MFDQFGRWVPDYPGQMMYNDPAFLRNINQQSQQPPVQQAAPAQPAIQNGGFVRVQNENAARMYPVAPGNSVTFVDDNAPFCYVKTMGFSQLEAPKFERYRLVKEDDSPSPVQQAAPAQPVMPDINLDAFALKTDVGALRDDMAALRKQVEDLENLTLAGGDENG